MARTCFPHRLERSKLVPGGTLSRPAAEIQVRGHSGQWVKFAPYVDSGADLTLFPWEAGDLLGLDPAAGEAREVTGIGGTKLEVRIHTLRVRLADLEFDARIGLAVADGWVPYLPGRMDVFDRFDVSFEEGKVCFAARRR